MEKATFKTICLALLLASTSVFSQGGSDFTGQLLYHYTYGISGVSAYLHNSEGNVVDSAVTDAQGQYQFVNVTPGTYTITFSTAQPEGGIELADAYLVLKKIFNRVTFTNIQFLAADVDKNGTIGWPDFIMILIGYLNNGMPFPEPWVFESVITEIPTESRTGFTTGGGSSSGDVNGSLVPDPKRSPILLESPFIDYTTDRSGSMEFNLAGSEELDIAGMHLVFSIPDELEIINVKCAIPEAKIFISGTRLNVTWIDESMQGVEISGGTPLLTIGARPKNISRDGGSYSIKLNEVSHFINSEGELIEGLTLSLPVLNVHLTDVLTCSAYPNPFSNSATIEYTLPEDGHVLIALYDQAGRQVQEVENNAFSAGRHQAKIDGTRLLPGIYHYTVSIADSKQNFSVGTIIKSK